MTMSIGSTLPGTVLSRCVSIAVFALGLIVANPASPQGTLRVSAIPDEAPTELQRKFAPLGRYLEQRTGMTVQFVPAKDYAAVVHALATGWIDLAWLGGFTYVQAMESTGGAVVALVQRAEDQQFTSKFVTTDPTIRSLADLRGKTFAFGSQDSTSGHLMPRYFLLQAGVQPERDFRNVTYSGAHDATAALVESRKVDAGVLNASVWDKLVEQKKIDPSKVRVFATTPPYHDYNWTVRGGMPRDLVKKLTDAFLELDGRNPQHAEILSLQRASRFIPTQPEYYAEIKKAIRAAGLPLTVGVAVKAPAIGPPIAASTVLRFPLTEIANQFWWETGQQVHITYGSAGTLLSQIENGAPFQMFLTTREIFLHRLDTEGIARDSGVVYAVGRVVLFAPNGSSLRVDPELKDLEAAVADGRIQAFVISDPKRSPYGRAARAVLQRAGIWNAIEPKLVVSETAGQAMELLARGSYQAGIVPLSLAKAQELDKLGNYAVLPTDSHREVPLEQGMVLLKNAGDIATEFYRYMQGPAARAVLMRYGFLTP
jgi:phosphonate transport system substrate-binding protein